MDVLQKFTFGKGGPAASKDVIKMLMSFIVQDCLPGAKGKKEKTKVASPFEGNQPSQAKPRPKHT